MTNGNERVPILHSIRYGQTLIHIDNVYSLNMLDVQCTMYMNNECKMISFGGMRTWKGNFPDTLRYLGIVRVRHWDLCRTRVRTEFGLRTLVCQVN